MEKRLPEKDKSLIEDKTLRVPAIKDEKVAAPNEKLLPRQGSVLDRKKEKHVNLQNVAFE